MRPNFDIAVRRARMQHGRVAWQQLLDEGIRPEQIKRWLADGRLHRVHDGIYAVGHTAPSLDADYMAAVLACGPGAVLSHRAAAFKLRLLRNAPSPPPEVTVPTTAGRSRPGIVVHRVKKLHQLDVADLDGIPITIVPRVLLDLAPRFAPADLGRACHEAWVHHRTTPAMVEACIARNPRKPGISKLRHALGSDVTLSHLEDAFLVLLEAQGLPRPRTNIDHAGDKVDCHWPDLGLTIELLSYAYHATRRAFDEDIARRRRSSSIAFSYGDIVDRPAATAGELAVLIDRHPSA